MSHPAVTVESIGKRYRIGHRAAPHDTFREAAMDLLATPVRRFRQLRETQGGDDTIWALRDVSFEVARGEVLGIIGRNGAGKSTLLKILSRITEPTEGTARIAGRVASLLEVGTGFHPELTGRENVYLNGAILGMKKAEIDRKFDDIVEFAEIEKFLDTPVKRYSSGMGVRLAFAVAAHLEPEILIVDEVLAVGDAAFQKRCLGKMQEVASGSGRTVLFVSHNMAAVRSLCQTGCYLEGGRVKMLGTADECASAYLEELFESNLSDTVRLERPGRAGLWMTSARLLCDDQPTATVPMGAEITLEVEFESEVPIRTPRFGYVIHTSDGARLINTNNRFQASEPMVEASRRGIVRCRLGMLPLVGGRYSISLWFGDQARDTHVSEYALTFEIVERDIWDTGKIPPPHDSIMWWPTEWELLPLGGDG